MSLPGCSSLEAELSAQAPLTFRAGELSEGGQRHDGMRDGMHRVQHAGDVVGTAGLHTADGVCLLLAEPEGNHSTRGGWESRNCPSPRDPGSTRSRTPMSMCPVRRQSSAVGPTVWAGLQFPPLQIHGLDKWVLKPDWVRDTRVAEADMGDVVLPPQSPQPGGSRKGGSCRRSAQLSAWHEEVRPPVSCDRPGWGGRGWLVCQTDFKSSLL